MRTVGICLLALMPLATPIVSAQDHSYAVSLSGSLSTSSELFPHTDNPDETTRNEFLPIDDLFGISLDIRRQFDALGIQIGLSIEYISKTESYSLPVSSSRSIPVEDGFSAIPLELSGYFTIPIGNETISLYMGGGGGVYFGSRHYSVASVPALTVGRTPEVGIHVLSGVQYSLSPTVSLRSEVKFRDVQFETVNRFTQSFASYSGLTVPLDPQPLVSRISINGMTLVLGLVFHL